MKHVVIVAAALCAVSCGSVEDRGACGVSADCPAGQYCARTPDGNVCWADAEPPVVSRVTVSCSTTPCRRDDVLHVEASASDGAELAGVVALLDLDGGERKVAMTRSGSAWIADLPLREWPFEAYSRPVVAGVVARDGARNEARGTAEAIDVTRLRWVYDAGVPMSPPAVMEDGTIVVGLSRATEQLVAIRQDGTKAWAATVGSSFVTAPPAVGSDAIWVGSDDSWLRSVALDGSAMLAGTVNLDGTVRGVVSISTMSGREWSFAASASGRVGATTTVAGEIAKTTAVSGYESGTTITKSGRVCAVSSGVSSTLRCFDFDGALAPVGAASIGVTVLAPLAIDSEDNIWSGSQDGRLNRSRISTAALETTTVTSLSSPIIDSPVITNGGDVLVGDAGGLLHRIDAKGNAVWSAPRNLGAAVSAPVLLVGGSTAIIVSTRGGTIHALHDDGTEGWRGVLRAGAELRSTNIFTADSQAAPVLSTALFTSTDGKLYAVIVDGELDTSAPWPKAFHDPRNTNNAGTQP